VDYFNAAGRRAEKYAAIAYFRCYSVGKVLLIWLFFIWGKVSKRAVGMFE